MKLGQEQEAFSRDLMKLIFYALATGYEVRISEVHRTTDQQKLYIKQGRSKTMNSMHLNKCAADLYFTKDGELVYPQELGDYWESLDKKNQWGGNWNSFKDKPHYQRTV